MQSVLTVILGGTLGTGLGLFTGGLIAIPWMLFWTPSSKKNQNDSLDFMVVLIAILGGVAIFIGGGFFGLTIGTTIGASYCIGQKMLGV